MKRNQKTDATIPATKSSVKANDSNLIVKQGILVKAKNVHLPDHTIVAEMTCGDPATGEFRRMDDNGRWVYGSIGKTAKGPKFRDSLIQSSTVGFPNLPLVDELNSDPAIKELIDDENFAIALFSGLTGIMWTDGESLNCLNYVEAGKFVAHLRDKGECYSDFLFAGEPDYITKEILEILGMNGWYPTNPKTRLEYPELATDIVTDCELRETEPVEAWVYYYEGCFFDGCDLMERMKRCCLNGQTTLTEWELFYLNFEL